MWKSILILLIYSIYAINSKLIITDFDYYYTKDGVIIRCLYDNGINDKNDKVQFLVNKTLIWSYDQNKTKLILNDRIDGAKLDIDNSNSTHLALRNVDRKISGMFSCVVNSVRTIENTKAERKFKFDTPNYGYLKQKLKINRPYHEINESYKEKSMKNDLTFKQSNNMDRNSIYNIWSNPIYKHQLDQSIENRIDKDKQKINYIQQKLNNPIDNEFIIIKQNDLKESNQNKQNQWSIDSNEKINRNIDSVKRLSYQNNLYENNQNNQRNNDFNQNDQFNKFELINNLNDKPNSKLANLINSDEEIADNRKSFSYKSELDSSREIPLTQQEIENSNEIIKREYLSYWTRINFIKLYSEIINLKRRIGLMPKFNPKQP